jgi:hypothetical protein
MNMPKFASRPLLAILCIVLAFSLTACGSAWVNAYNPAIDEFTKALEALNPQLESVSNDINLVADGGWQNRTRSALATLKNAATQLENLPTPEDPILQQADILAKQVAAESNAAAAGYYAIIDAGELSLIDDPNSHMDKINELIPQINALIGQYNQ